MFVDETLRRDVYPLVKSSMLSATPKQKSRPSGVRNLRSRSFAAPLAGAKYADMSFARQMHDVLQQPSSKTKNEKLSSPDLFLLTYKSAIPVADAIRGYYEVLEQPEPIISFVRPFKEQNTDGSSNEKLIENEITRLEQLVQHVANVCVVDQFVSTGNTIKRARNLIDQAAGGETTGTVIRGDWYGQANQIGPTQIEQMTSKHADFMRRIGQVAAEQFEN